MTGVPAIFLLLQGEESIVTCLDEQRHGFETGDYVTFKEVLVGIIEITVMNDKIDGSKTDILITKTRTTFINRYLNFLTGHDRVEQL